MAKFLKFLIHRPKWVVAVVGILIFWLTQAQWLTGSELWQRAEGPLIDERYAIRGEDAPDSKIKLLGINNSTISLDDLNPGEITNSPTLQIMQQPWPWDRRVYAAVLEKLVGAGAKVVVFDFVFAAETDGDDVFAQALDKYKDHVVIGAQFSPEESNNGIHVQYTGPNADLLLPGATNIVGMVNMYLDKDGIVRRGRYRTSITRESAAQPGISAAGRKTLEQMIASGKAPDDLTHMSALAVEKFTGHVNIPPYSHDNFINLIGPRGSYDPLPLEDIFVDELWKAPPFKGGITFSNKIVVVGPIAEIFHDVHETAFGEMPGPEIQAEMMTTLLRNDSLKEPSPRTAWMVALLAVLVALGICLGIPQALLKGLLLVAATVAFLVTCQELFNHCDLVMPMMPSLVCLLGTGSFGIIFEYTLEQLEKRRYRHLFGRYVSKNVADVILEDTRSLEESLRGQRKRVTILFSDIRNFTTMTETTDPDKLVAQLNEYFDAMIDIIQEKTSGTLQKFIGDAIMAAWGDTHSSGFDMDAKRAVTAALQMRAALKKLNATWKDNPDRSILATGIGVNHGEVIYGNIGSQDRTELTVLGDGVNLAARLESATKQFHTDILIGEETEKLTREHFVYRKVAAVAFRGKTKPVETFVLISDRTLPPPAWLEPYHAGVKLYRARQFKEAVEMFEKVQSHIGTEDYLCTMYLSRSRALMESGVPGNWDGAFTLSEK